MMILNAVISLHDLMWSSDWSGDDIGFPDVKIIGLYQQEREDGLYSFYIDIENMEILDLWKAELED